MRHLSLPVMIAVIFRTASRILSTRTDHTYIRFMRIAVRALGGMSLVDGVRIRPSLYTDVNKYILQLQF